MTDVRDRLAAFGPDSTVDDVVADVDLSGKRAVVTGATSGIGVETARALARAGAHVVLAVRRPDAGAEVAADIRESTGNPEVEVAELDLSRLDTVHRFAASVEQPLHILVNNAGIMALPTAERTPEGWELQFATNFLGHYALVRGLEQALVGAGAARVICLSSAAHFRSPVIFDDLHFRYRLYDPWLAYGQSKTADVLLAVGLEHRWGGRGVRGFAVHPGIIHTGLQKHIEFDTGGLPLKTPAQGAATAVLVASAPDLDAEAPTYWQDCAPAPVVATRPGGFSPGVAPYALDADNASRLWGVGDRMLSESQTWPRVA